MNVIETYISITFLRVNRADSATYWLIIYSSNRESSNSAMEISVECKYKRRTKKFTRQVYRL